MKIYILPFVFFCFLLIGLKQTATAQTNYATIKVDELSDAKIRELMQRAESIGYNDTQLEQMAAAQGMKQEEILKLRKRVADMRKQSKVDASLGQEIKKNNQGGRQINGETDVTSQKEETKEELLNRAFDDLKPKIFGAELFKNSNMTFAPDLRLATPKSYVIGPDDQLLIDLSGDNEANYDLKVSPEGTITVQYVGAISVGGLTIEQATEKIKSAFAGTYRGLRTGRTKLAINLGNIRSIKVTLNGQVTKPGTYTLSSLSSVFNALYASGGPNENGSFRNIQVIRNNKLVSTIDIYDFLINGIQKTNIRLQDQDVINIPVYSTQVEVSGEVKNPAIFEANAGERFDDILRFAGGFSTTAYQARVKVIQNTERERKITDIFSTDFSTYEPKNGDKYFVEPILDRFENKVEIEGAVFRPGFYELEKGLTLSGLIKKSEGLKEDAFLSRGYVSRLNADNSIALLSFDLAKVKAGNEDIVLQREDKVTISSIFDLRDEYRVSIGGEVREPGTFGFAENMTLADLIQMAGGFKDSATPNRIEISRRIKDSNVQSKGASIAQVFTISVDQNLNLIGDPFVLKPYDIVAVRAAEGYQIQKQVFVEGEVLFPGTYTVLSKDERISDLIKRAGGLTSAAYVDGASLKRPGSFKVSDPRAIDNSDEQKNSLATLKRSQRSAGVDSTKIGDISEVIASDLVGINLPEILKKPGGYLDLLLEEGDIIRIPRQLQTVKVSGEVLNPNNGVYVRGKGFKRYINTAGGFNVRALKKGSFIKYANGSVEGSSNFLFFRSYPKVKPGSEIFVPLRPEKEKLNAQAWIGIGTAIASLGAIIVTLLK